MEPSESFEVLGQFPHCDHRVLHRKGACAYCDNRPIWQALRVAWDINFTGEDDPKKAPCPSTKFRTVELINRWPGNRPMPEGVDDDDVPPTGRPPSRLTVERCVRALVDFIWGPRLD